MNVVILNASYQLVISLVYRSFHLSLTLRASVASYGYFPSSLILAALIMKALSSSETSDLIRVTRRNIPEDSILQNLLCL
jgi:hypothetical protein